MKFDLFDKNAPKWVCLYCSRVIRATPEPKYANSQVNLPDTYWDTIFPFLIENWSPDLRALLGDVSIVRFLGSWEGGPAAYRAAIKALADMDKDGICFDEDILQSFESYERKFDQEVKKFGVSFIKTSLRSPKDSVFAKKRHYKVRSGRDALCFLLDSRERFYDDLLLFRKFHYTPSVIFQTWRVTPVWSEFRCFVKNRKLIGISQDDHEGLPYYSIVHKNNEAIREAIEEFFYKIYLPVVHVDDSVFEVSVMKRKEDKKWQARFVEVNPLASTTDPCLFSWKDDLSDFDGSFRYVTQEQRQNSFKERLDFLERALGDKI
jgi:hypothetical protein